MTDRFSETVTAAYVLLVLQQRGMLTQANAKDAAALFGLHAEDQAQAETRSILRPKLVVEFTQPAEKPSGPKATRKKTGGVPENRRNTPDGPERRCTRCKEWKPADHEHFGFSDAKTRRLRSWCRPCWNAYQRERYVTRAQEEQLADAGLTWTLEEDVKVLSCAKCGGSLLAGQEVVGHTEIAHTSCGDGEENDACGCIGVSHRMSCRHYVAPF